MEYLKVLEYVKTLPEEVVDKLANEVKTLTIQNSLKMLEFSFKKKFYLKVCHTLTIISVLREGTERSLRQNSTLSRMKMSAKGKRNLV